MTCEYDFVEDDNGALKVTCLDEAGAVIPLTGATVTLNWVDDVGGAPVTRPMAITDELNGLAEYEFQTGELIPPTIIYEVNIVDINGDEVTNNCLEELKIRSKII